MGHAPFANRRQLTSGKCPRQESNLVYEHRKLACESGTLQGQFQVDRVDEAAIRQPRPRVSEGSRTLTSCFTNRRAYRVHYGHHLSGRSCELSPKRKAWDLNPHDPCGVARFSKPARRAVSGYLPIGNRRCGQRPSRCPFKWRVRGSHPAVQAYETRMSTGPPASSCRSRYRSGHSGLMKASRAPAPPAVTKGRFELPSP